MKTMKTLMLASLTVLTVGAGAAMAQETGGVMNDYWVGQYAKARQAPVPGVGSSQLHSFWVKSAPAHNGGINDGVYLGGDGG